MATKVLFFLCAQVLLIQVVFTQRLTRRSSEGMNPYGFCPRAWGYEGVAYEGMPFSDGRLCRGVPSEGIGYYPPGPINEYPAVPEAAIESLLAPGDMAMMGGPIYEPIMTMAPIITETTTATAGAAAAGDGAAASIATATASATSAAVAPAFVAPAIVAPAVIAPATVSPAYPCCGTAPTIAPTASLAVVVMDSSIQNLFENLWNVH